MFNFYNFHFKGKINEQPTSNNLMKLLLGRRAASASFKGEAAEAKPTCPPTPGGSLGGTELRTRLLPPRGAAGGGNWCPRRRSVPASQVCREAGLPAGERGGAVAPGMRLTICPLSSPKTRGSGGEHTAPSSRSHSGHCQKVITARG